MKLTATRIEGIAAMAAAALLAIASTSTLAAGTHGHAAATHGGATKGHGEMMGHHTNAQGTGVPGKAEEVSRTIEIKMYDNYYEPEEIGVKEGETIRFIVKNAGQLVHEFNLGTQAMHTAHQQEMVMMVQHGALHPDRIDQSRMMMDMGGGKTMKHDDPNSVLLEPGK